MTESARPIARAIALAALAMFLISGVRAADSDLSAVNTPPMSITLGTPFTVTVGYANAGPDTAVSAYVNTTFIPPTGLDVFIDNYNNGGATMYDEILATAVGTDTNGNVPKLFWDDFNCEKLYFQLQGDTGPTSVPMLPLGAGGSGSFSYGLTLPTTGAKTGTVEITAPPALVDSWTLTDPSNSWVEYGLATVHDRYSTSTCDKLVGTPTEDICDYIGDNCWGTMVSHLDAPIDAEFALVDDGSANPTHGCASLIGFPPGGIAVVRRGTCEFGEKAFYAESAGAAAVFMVNDRRCSDFPDSDFCVINMGAGALGALVTIPVVMVSYADGEPVIAAIVGGDTVTGVFGSASSFATSSYVFLSDLADLDPVVENNVAATTTTVDALPSLIFSDDFELGTTGAWSYATP
jgi:hypothetical protein